MPDIAPRPHPEFDAFVATIAALRAPDGCPWDKEQTHVSIAPNMIEEAYEAVDAIERDDVDHMREELGDVLLQVVLQSQIAADEGQFTIDDVCRDINEKIIRRHPHVFGNAKGGTANEVITLWDKIKMEEKQNTEDSEDTSMLDSVATSFPALLQAQKISRKAVAAGFEWKTISDVWDKFEEEAQEFKDAYDCAPKDDTNMILHESDLSEDAEMEFGDMLFTLVNVARKAGINSEEALRKSCNKFRKRFCYMEKKAAESGSQVEDMEMDELERLWAEAKEAAL